MQGIMQIGFRKIIVEIECLVSHRCPSCGGEEVRDAYAGPVVHVQCPKAGGRDVVMTPESFLHPPRAQRTTVLDAGASERLARLSKDKGVLDRAVTELLDEELGEVTPR